MSSSSGFRLILFEQRNPNESLCLRVFVCGIREFLSHRENTINFINKNTKSREETIIITTEMFGNVSNSLILFLTDTHTQVDRTWECWKIEMKTSRMWKKCRPKWNWNCRSVDTKELVCIRRFRSHAIVGELAMACHSEPINATQIGVNNWFGMCVWLWSVCLGFRVWCCGYWLNKLILDMIQRGILLCLPIGYSAAVQFECISNLICRLPHKNYKFSWIVWRRAS